MKKTILAEAAARIRGPEIGCELTKGGYDLVEITGRAISVRGKVRWIAVVIGLILLCGCGAKLPFVKDTENSEQEVIHGNAPKSIAILPFGNQTDSEDIDEIVRTTFYSHLSAQPYKDIELYEVDRKLRRYNLMDHEKLSDVSVKRLGRILRCDAVVVGEVTEFQRLYAGIYSQMAVGAAITVWDTRTGEKIWSDEHVTRSHEGGIPLAITDLAMIGVRSGMNLTESEKIKTVDELSRHFTNRIPIPDLSGNGKGPRFVSLKRLTKSKNQISSKRKLRSLKKLTKVEHPQYR
ncbi:MAG: DUF799 family lipoprotein [Desulfobacteraceae bacterium]|jgi:hypothetical protein